MNLQELKTTCMHQTGNDADDLEDYVPYLDSYINEAYDRVTQVWDNAHVASDSEVYPTLSSGQDTPNLPEWIHPALANFATYCLYRNGSAPKQQRGLEFLRAFLAVLDRIREEGGKAGAEAAANGQQQYPARNFFNIPR